MRTTRWAGGKWQVREWQAGVGHRCPYAAMHSLEPSCRCAQPTAWLPTGWLAHLQPFPPLLVLSQPKQQTAKALEGLLLKALKGAALTADQRADVLEQLGRLELPLQAARAALGGA